jgi:hypothetical protein
MPRLVDGELSVDPADEREDLVERVDAPVPETRVLITRPTR